MFNKFKLLDLAADIATGDTTRNGDRIAAIRFIADYAFGKPTQPISGPDGGPLLFKVVRE